MTDSAPQHDELGPVTRFIELLSIIVAAGLVIALGYRFLFLPDLRTWWTPVIIATAFFTTDFMSGMVHWFADTWGSERMPILGRRLLRPFRVHHINPDDFLRRNFVDTNGDVAMLVSPLLVLGLILPVDTPAQFGLALFLGAVGIAGLPTNQVHRWAHRYDPPAWVKKFQDYGLILSRKEHLRHHREPYDNYYCIAFGWCNGILGAVGFFEKLEQIVTLITGVQPRADDTEFAVEHAVGPKFDDPGSKVK